MHYDNLLLKRYSNVIRTQRDNHLIHIDQFYLIVHSYMSIPFNFFLKLAPSGTYRDVGFASFEVGSAHNTWAGAGCVECAAVGSRTQYILLGTAVGVAVPFTCQTALVRCANGARSQTVRPCHAD
jgi:hypothetical protein